MWTFSHHNHFLYVFVPKAGFSAGGETIMSWKTESDGLSAVDFWSIFIGSIIIGRHTAPEPLFILYTHTHTNTLTHIGALNRWQARQDYLGPLPRKTTEMRWFLCLHETHARVWQAFGCGWKKCKVYSPGGSLKVQGGNGGFLEYIICKSLYGLLLNRNIPISVLILSLGVFLRYFKLVLH